VTTGTLLDRTEASEPVGQNLNISNWLVLAAMPDTNFRLTFINPGSFSSTQCFLAPAVQQTCTIPASPTGALSPYELSNTMVAGGGSISSTAAFSVRGTATNGTDVTSFVGRFDANFLNTSYQQLLAMVNTPGGFVDAPFTATITFTAVPEPSTLFQLVSGLALAGVAAFGKSRLRRR